MHKEKYFKQYLLHLMATLLYIMRTTCMYDDSLLRKFMFRLEFRIMQGVYLNFFYNTELIYIYEYIQSILDLMISEC
jgi:hypothetical protein